MNKISSVILRKCKSLSRLGRSNSYSSLRPKSTKEDVPTWHEAAAAAGDGTVVFVGSSRRRYVISAKHLSHPVIAALIDRQQPSEDEAEGARPKIAVKCEVVLFDHLLWMLDNADDLRVDGGGGDDGGSSLRELAELYAY